MSLKRISVAVTNGDDDTPHMSKLFIIRSDADEADFRAYVESLLSRFRREREKGHAQYEDLLRRIERRRS